MSVSVWVFKISFKNQVLRFRFEFRFPTLVTAKGGNLNLNLKSNCSHPKDFARGTPRLYDGVVLYRWKSFYSTYGGQCAVVRLSWLLCCLNAKLRIYSNNAKLNTVSPTSRHRSDLPPSCVALVLRCGDGFRHSLHVLVQFREYNQDLFDLSITQIYITSFKNQHKKREY